MVDDGEGAAGEGADRLRFESIEVERFRGFEPPGFRIDGLSEGVNVVYGPNASGKSTLATAAQRLIWPGGAERASLGARLRVGSTTWEVELDSGRLRRRSDPPGVDFPEVPPAEHAGRYHLYLQELLQATDERFARAVQRDAAGGFDVEAAASALDFADVSPRTSGSTEEVEEARRRRQALRDKHEELRGRERRLDELQEQLERAEEAEARVERVDAALAYVEAEREVEAVRDRLESFEEAHERLRGDEDEELDELEQRRRELERACQQLDRQLRDEREAVADDPLPESGVSEGRVATVEGKVGRLEELDRERRKRRELLDRLETRKARTSARISSVVEPDAVDELELPDLEELEAFLRREDELRADESAREAFRREFRVEDPPDEAALEQYRTGARRLRRWLAAASASGDTDVGERAGRGATWSTAAGVAVALLGALLGWLIHLAALVFVALGVAVVVLVRWRGGETDEAGGGETSPEMHRREFRQTVDLAPPDSWTVDGVEARLGDIEEQLAEATVRHERAELWERKANEFDQTAERREAVEAERERLAEELGVEPDVATAPLARVWVDLDQFWEVADEVAEERAALEGLEAEEREVLESVAEIFEAIGFRTPDSVDHARGLLDELRGARERRAERERSIDELERRLERRRADLEEVRQRREAIYDRLGLEVGEREGVVELCRNHEDWSELQSELAGAEQTVDVRRRDLEAFESFDEALLEESKEALEDRREALAERAAERDDLADRVSAIRHEIEERRSSRELERASADYRRARETLAEERREDYLRMTGHRLANFVRDRTRDRELPEVFHRARELLAAVTRGRYRLELGGDESATFRAFDVNRREHRQLEALSSGTRLQLLLAVRVAFVEKEESGVALPLVLDEAFANSDRQRAAAMVETVEQLAAKGRQIFYFTAQRDEVRQWRARLEASEVPSHRVFDLRRVVGGDAETRVEGWDLDVEELEMARDVPEPAGTHEAYAEQLGVGSWSPREPVESLHLWYLVEDLELLRALLEAGVARWGQLEELAERDALGAVDLPEETWRRLRARADAARAFAEAWRVGRGRPVDRRVLEDSGAVSSNFIDEVSELADELGGDGAALVEALEAGEVKRFRSDKAEELATYLREHDYVESRETLDEEAIRTRVMAAVAGALEEGVVDREELDRLIQRLF